MSDKAKPTHLQADDPTNSVGGPLNLKMMHAIVGPFLGGQVVPTSAVEGGLPECDRLVDLGAAQWTEEECNVSPPVARSAVAEMTDDQLKAENERLRRELEAERGKKQTVSHSAVQQAVVRIKADHAGEVA